jgi:DNA transformation protein
MKPPPRSAPPASPGDPAAWPNLGPASRGMLAAAGLQSMDEVRALGAVAAYARVRRTSPRASLNLLWALEGAMSGLPWQQVAREHRASLLLALETYEAGEAGGGEGVAGASGEEAAAPGARIASQAPR